MRRFTAALLVLGLVSVTTRDAAAQPSDKDIAAAAAIAYTPVGAFTPFALNKGWDANGKFGLAGRYGMLSPKVGDSDNSIGATGSMGVGTNAVVSGTLGYTMVGCPSGTTCENGMLLGADILSSLWSSATNAMHVKFQGSLGWSSFGDAGSFLSAVVGAPLVWVVDQSRAAKGTNGRASLFLQPGFGWGRMSQDTPVGSQSESGTRPLISAGGQYVMSSGMGIHVGYTRVIIEDAANVFGLGVTWNFGGAAK
jgi:hypothetical protein